MKRFIKSILSLFQFLSYFIFTNLIVILLGNKLIFLFQVFLVFIIVVGISSRNIKLPLFIGLNFIMTVISLIFGYFFIDDDGGWFKPFGRDAAIVFVSIIYILGQLIIRLFSRLVHTNSRSNK